MHTFLFFFFFFLLKFENEIDLLDLPTCWSIWLSWMLLTRPEVKFILHWFHMSVISYSENRPDPFLRRQASAVPPPPPPPPPLLPPPALVEADSSEVLSSEAQLGELFSGPDSLAQSSRLCRFGGRCLRFFRLPPRCFLLLALPPPVFTFGVTCCRWRRLRKKGP